MLDKVEFDKILFLDIETAPQVYNFDELDDAKKQLFLSKTRGIHQGDETRFEEAYDSRSSIFAEFGKIICISVGFVHVDSLGVRHIRLKSFYHDDEETLLRQFCKLLNENYNTASHILCGHNAKEFDFPYICRRLLINEIKLPKILNIAGKKPWEINHIDTMELWKFGDFKAYTSLPLLCNIFNVPTPKDDISGADVARVYYEENDLERIKIYCEKDVAALIQVFLKLKGDHIIEEDNIKFT